MLIFIHIAKTGGLSLRNTMLGPRTMVCSHEADFEKKVKLAWMKKKDILLGHIPYGIHKYTPGEYEYLTILRHPAERVYSKYTYNYRFAPAKQPKLCDFMEQKCAWNVQNLAVRQLCGLGLPYHGIIEEHHYNEATKNLSTIKYLGFTDNLNVVFGRVKSDYGLRGNLPNTNVTKNNKLAKLDKKDVELISSYNKWDIKLYDFAKSL